MSDRVTVSITNGVADVRLNRADKLNALDSQMFAAIRDTGRELAADNSLRAVVLSGEGRAFCAGLDFSGFRAMRSGEGGGVNLLEREAGSAANLAQLAAWTWAELPVPVIAAVHGYAFGGGFQIAMACDIRIAAPDAKLSIMEIRWGLIPDMSGTQTLRRLLPLDVIKELTFTGRRVSGSEAKELGLVTRLSDDPHADAMALAQEIAKKSPHAIRAGKKLLNASGVISVEEGLKLEEQLQLSLIGKPNQMEAVGANLEKRDPNFEDPDA